MQVEKPRAKKLDDKVLGIQLQEKTCDCCSDKFTPRSWADRHQEVCYTCLLDGLGGNH